MPPEFAQELVRWLKAWRKRWLSHRGKLEDRERYLYCGLGAFTYFFALHIFPISNRPPMDQSLQILLQSWEFALYLSIYVVVPTLVIAAITGHSERPRGRIGLYLDGFLLPLAVTYLLDIVR